MTLQAGTRLGHYEVVSLLGAGGMGEVYRGRDERLNRPVALKFLGTFGSADRTAVDRFEREARAASALNHPNIVTVYDIGESEAGRFIAMEFVDGRTLRAIAETQPPFERLCEIGRQVAKALAAAHAAGIVHRDIKPDNIMVREDGYVKVLDFGLARLVANPLDTGLAPTRMTTMAGTLLGTVPYMSPEQARTEHVTEMSDVFSLGIILYEIATRSHPFGASSPIGMLTSIVSQTPILPTHVNPELPPAFEDLIVDMLQKDARLRPTAVDVEVRLGDILGGKPGRAAGTPLGVHRPLIGRDADEGVLSASLDAAVAGRGLMVAIAAEAGLGKTTLVEHFLQRVAIGQQPRCLIGRGRCSERLAGTDAYLPFIESLEALLRGEQGDGVARAMRLRAPAWFDHLHPPESGVRSGARLAPPAASVEQMKRQLLALVTELASTQPLVLFLDDVHWADASTVDLITYLGDRLNSLRMVLIVTYRPSDLLLTSHPFAQTKLNLSSRGICRELALEPFSRGDVERYLATAYPGNGFSASFVGLLHERTEGAPLFIVELMRQFASQGVVAEADGSWELTQSVGDLKSDLPESMRSLIQRTIDRLDDVDRRLLVAASVQGVAFDSGVVARAIGMPSMEVEEHLERLQRVHSLVRLVEERELAGREPSLRYAFVHILYQNALHESLRATRRAALSGAVAGALEACYGEQPAMASQLAVLHEAARNYPKAARQFLVAARSAASVQAHREAVALARRGLEALRVLEQSPETERLELELQLSLGVPLTSLQGYASAEVETAYSRARDICAQLGETPSLIPALHGLYRFYIVRGRLRQSCDIVRQIIALAEGTQDPGQVIVARMALGAPLVHLGEFEEAADHLTADLALSEQSKRLGDTLQAGADPGMTARLWLTLALWLLGRPGEALARNREALEIAGKVPAPFGVAYAQCLTAWFHQYRGDATQTNQHAEHAIRVAREHDFAQWLALGTMYRGWALVALDDVGTGMALLTGGLAGFRRTGAELNLPHFLSLLADAHLRAGSADEGIAAVDQAIVVADANDDRCWEPELHRLRGELLLKQAGASGPRGADAEQAFRRAIEVATRYKSRSLDLRAAVSLGRLLLAQGRAAEVAGVVAPVAAMLAAQPTAELEDARALLAASGGQTAR